MAETARTEKKTFEPLQIIGYFWTFFGVVVALATFFVRESSYVPEVRGQVTNLIAAALLLGAGVSCIVFGRRRKLRKLLAD